MTIKATPPFIIHENYKANTESGLVVFDLAILKLSTPVNFALYPHVRPICLPDGQKIRYKDDLPGVVAGWGQTFIHRSVSRGDLHVGQGSHLSDVIRKLNVRYIHKNTSSFLTVQLCSGL